MAVLPAVGAATLGAVGSRSAPDTYAQLNKPTWAPPASAFGPVWSSLYPAIVTGWRTYAASPNARRLHLAQLALNAAWPNVFFKARHKRLSLAVIAVLDATIATEAAVLRRDHPVAAALLLPYLGWCGFATALNAAISNPAHRAR